MSQHRFLPLIAIALATLLLLAWSPPDRPAPVQKPTPPPPLVTHGSRMLPEVALTFDACPAVGYDAVIVHVLTETQTPATFFLSGRWMQGHVTATQTLASVPYFELGEHSWSHSDFSRLGLARMDDEITRTEKLLTQLSGRRGTLFRFPYGYYSSRAIQEVYRMGLTPIQWDVVSADPAPSMSAKAMTKHMLAQTQNGSIIIMHVNGRGWHTAQALPGIITELYARGFRLVTISHLLADSASSSQAEREKPER
jgi:peptidoglycan/xylan/chitin deacetylase (PgdA/CDA1 family)